MIMRRQQALPPPAARRAARQRETRGWRRPAALLLHCAGLAAAIAGPGDALAAYTVTLNTSSLAGTSARLEFDLFDGDAAANNSVTVSSIVSNGTFVASDCSLGCTGGPPFVISDALGLGQLLYDLTLGTSLSFSLAFTTNYAGVPGTDPADRFALSLLDPGTNFTLVATDIAFPDDALLAVDLTGAGTVQAAGVTSPAIGILAVPEPGSLLLATTALLALAGRRGFGASRAPVLE